MRARGIGLAPALALGAAVPAGGGEAEALRREMEQVRRQLEALPRKHRKAHLALFDHKVKELAHALR